MAWLTQEDARTFTSLPQEPDMETLTYWVQRMEPIIRAEGEDEIIVVFANRCGVEGETVYAGTSAVLGVQNGEVSVYGLLGRGAKELLVVNTDMPPFAKLVSRSEGPRKGDEAVNAGGGTSGSAAVAAPARGKSTGQRSTDRTIPPFPDDEATTDSEHDQGYAETEYFNTPNYARVRDTASSRGHVSPRNDRIMGSAVPPQDGYEEQYYAPARETKGHGRTASTREGYSPKVSPVFRRAASTRDGYSPRFPSPREEYAPRVASPRDGYSPGFVSTRNGHSPGVISRGKRRSPGNSSPRGYYTSTVPSPKEWYGITDSPTASTMQAGIPGQVSAAVGGRGWDDEVLADLASPTFPEPTPMSLRPKLAISTGPETLPPMPKRAPPRGVQPGNFFSSRDLCTPPETPFDEEPQPFIQQHWIPPSAFMHTPEEPEWPDTITGVEARNQLPRRRPSPAKVSNKTEFSRTPPRTVSSRPASRTQEVKLSDLDVRTNDSRYNQDLPSRQASKSRNSSRVRGPERRPTPAIGERSVPRLRNKKSEPVMRSSRDNTLRPETFQSEDRRTEPKGLSGPVQTFRDTAFPWNSITIAASPSVFKTQFQRSETFPRSDPRAAQPKSATGWDAAQTRSSERERLKRSKSISAFRQDATDYLPSPALPVHKAYQDMIYSAVEPAVSIDSMWAAAGAGVAAAAPRRHGSVSAGRGAGMRDGLMKPDILSPMSV